MSHWQRLTCRFFALALSTVLLGACSVVGSTSSGPPTEPIAPASPTLDPNDEVPAGSVSVRSPEEADRIATGVVELALEVIGTPYQWGGTDANGFDCSGLIQYAYGQFGIRMPRVSTAQIESGSAIGLDPGQLKAGDILGFSLDDPEKTSHVGLYIGDNEFIHSSSSGVRVSNLVNPYWEEHLIAARRIVE